MLGSLLAGTEESPGETVYDKGRAWKEYRGMGSLGALQKYSTSRERYREESNEVKKLVPEGIEGRVPFKGKLEDVIIQYVGGLRKGMGYAGAATIEELRRKGDFHFNTEAGEREGHVHGVQITKEAPNYHS